MLAQRYGGIQRPSLPLPTTACTDAPPVNTASTLFAPPPSRTSTTQPLTWPPARVASAGGVFIGAWGNGAGTSKEGISADVSGMVPGNKYALSFYQANAGLEGGTYGTPLGSTGRWEVKSRHGLSPPASGRALHMRRPSRLIRSRSVLGSCFRRRCPTWEKEPDLDAKCQYLCQVARGRVHVVVVSLVHRNEPLLRPIVTLSTLHFTLTP